jgi:NADH:ubiquinone oxidoreductase subunit K
MTPIAIVPLQWFLLLGAIIFFIGLFGALTRRNAIGVLISIELMLNAVNINLVAFSRFLPQGETTLAGNMLVVFIIALAAAAAAVGLAIVLSIVRGFKSIDTLRINIMRW